MKQNEEFENWTTYDAWLVKNYSEYSITSVNEVNGKIICEYIDKSDPIPEDDEEEKSGQ